MHPFGSRIRARDEDKPSLARAFVQCAPHAAVFFLGVRGKRRQPDASWRRLRHGASAG